MTGYTSPYGKPRGLRARLADYRAKLSDRQYPWHGTGLIDDMELIMAILDKREWLEAMRLSDDADAQRFAAELLDDDETLDAAWQAAETAQRDNVLSVDTDTADPVAVTEELAKSVEKAQGVVAAMRRTLERAGVVDDETPDEMLPDLLQALLA